MLTLDPGTAALAIIDRQRGIAGLPLTPHAVSAVVERSVAMVDMLARAGWVVALVNVDCAAGYADRPGGGVDAPLSLPAAGLPDGCATLLPEVDALPAQVRVTKRQHSAFFGTELDLQSSRRGIRTVVVCGLAMNFGVEGTARDAQARDHSVVVASDTCSSTGEGLHAFAIEHILPRVARVLTTSEIRRVLGFAEQD